MADTTLPTLTMIPGPTPVVDSILAALASPTTSHQDPRFVGCFQRCLQSLQQVARASTAQPLIVPGSATLAMEMTLVNLLGPGDRLLVLSQGYFGDRWAQIAEAFGIDCTLERAAWGEVVTPARLSELLASSNFHAVAMTHVETSTGAEAPIEAYAQLLRRRATLGLLDSVCAMGGLDTHFDAWGLDALVSGAQKALGAPPGVGLLLLSSRALERRRALRAVPAYFADVMRWLPVMEQPARYFATPPVNELMALDVALRLATDEGLERRAERHAATARAVRAGLDLLELPLFTAPACRAATLSVVCYPEGVADDAFRAAVARRGVVIAGGLGPLAGRAFRIGHMGNIGAEEIGRLLDALEAARIELGWRGTPGAARAAAELVV